MRASEVLQQAKRKFAEERERSPLTAIAFVFQEEIGVAEGYFVKAGGGESIHKWTIGRKGRKAILETLDKAIALAEQEED